MIYIVRHGKTVWNGQARKQGQSDSPLTLKGIEQASDVAKFLEKNVDTSKFNFYVSPLFRTMQYSALILEKLGIDNAKLVKVDELKEHSFGYWEGMTEEEIEKEYPNFLEKRYANWWEYIVPGGESYELISKRATKFLNQIKDEDAILFTHEMISKVLRGSYTNMSTQEILDLKHPQNIIYGLEDGQITVFDIND